jgi:hypothetical protein
MKQERKRGLLAMGIFGAMGVANYVTAVYFTNETSGFMLTFGSFILGFAFVMGLREFICG